MILARTDLKTSELKLSNPRTGHFVTNVEYPTDFGTITVLRGWASVDAKIRGRQLRFISTHLEADSETSAWPRRSRSSPDRPTEPPGRLHGRRQLNANGDATSAAYFAFIRAGFADAWFEAHPGRSSRPAATRRSRQSGLSFFGRRRRPHRPASVPGRGRLPGSRREPLRDEPRGSGLERKHSDLALRPRGSGCGVPDSPVAWAEISR